MGHPGIGAALGTLLRIEDRYELRRAPSPEEAMARLGDRVADVAVVDGVVKNGRMEELAMPAIVLSGNLADGKRLAARLAPGRAWLRKDATAEELSAAIDHAIKRPGTPSPTTALVTVLLSAIVVVAVAVVLAWYAFRLRG